MDSRSRYLREGIIAGLIGAAIVAAWFLIYDAARGQPLRTPAMLGAAAFQGMRDPSAVAITPGLVAQYTVLHGVVFALFGILIAYLIVSAQSQPSRLLVVFIALMSFEVAFLAVLTWWAQPVVTALGWWTILVANALAAGGRVHGRPGHGLRPLRMDRGRPARAGRQRAARALRLHHALLLLRGLHLCHDLDAGPLAARDHRLVDHPRGQPPGGGRDARLFSARAPGGVAGVPARRAVRTACGTLAAASNH